MSETCPTCTGERYIGRTFTNPTTGRPDADYFPCPDCNPHKVSTLATLTQRTGRWVTQTFGLEILTSRRERALRIAEEAIELAQAEGIERTQTAALVEHVYDRPVGDPDQEAAGIGVCLLAWAACTGRAIHQLIERELTRVESLPRERFLARRQEKITSGLSATSLPADAVVLIRQDWKPNKELAQRVAASTEQIVARVVAEAEEHREGCPGPDGFHCRRCGWCEVDGEQCLCYTR